MLELMSNPSIHDATLIKLLHTCGEFRATDPRDHIYGLFGMARDVRHLQQTGHSLQPVQNLHVQVTTHLLKNTQSLELIQMAGVSKCRHMESVLALPSWVPDYSRGLVFDWKSNMWMYAAGMSRVATPRFVNGTVSLQGWVVDRIDRLGSECFHLHHAWHRWLTATMDLTATTHPAGLTELALDASWRTLIGNVGIVDNGRFGQKPAPTHYSRYFMHLRAICLHPKYAQKSWEEASADVCNDPAILYRNKQEARLLAEKLWKTINHRRFPITSRNDMALVPAETQVGDIICISEGARIPFVIREKSVAHDGQCLYELVGECYVHELMQGYGQLLGTLQDITLV